MEQQTRAWARIERDRTSRGTLMLLSRRRGARG